MTAGVCQCGHNRSFHRNEWNKFRGEQDTSCRSASLGITGRDECRCEKFATGDADVLDRPIVGAE
jgi:hypothetical protein